METDSGKVLRRKVEKNFERKVKRTRNCTEGTEWEEKVGVAGSLAALDQELGGGEEKTEKGGMLACCYFEAVTALLPRGNNKGT